jgi:hypothetical protein
MLFIRLTMCLIFKDERSVSSDVQTINDAPLGSSNKLYFFLTFRALNLLFFCPANVISALLLVNTLCRGSHFVPFGSNRLERAAIGRLTEGRSCK